MEEGNNKTGNQSQEHHFNWDVKSLVLKLIDRIEKKEKIIALAITFLTVVGAFITVGLLSLQNHSLNKQTQILSNQYEATYRPFLGIEDISTKTENDFVVVSFNVKNYGQVPATRVDAQNITSGSGNIDLEIAKYDKETNSFPMSIEWPANNDLTTTPPATGNNSWRLCT